MKQRQLSIVFFIALTLLPLLAGLVFCILYSLGLVGILKPDETLQPWKLVLYDPIFWKSVAFSFYIGLVSTMVSTVLALFLVLKLQKALFKGFFAYLIYLPLTMPAMVVAFYVFQMLSGAGFLSRVSQSLGFTSGVEGFPDLVQDPYGVGILFAHIFMATPFFTILFANLYRQEGLEAFQKIAHTLGATSWQSTRKIVIPILLNRAFSTLVLYFVFILGSYEIPLLLGNQSTRMISVLTIQKLQRFDLAEKPQAYVISILYTLVIFLTLVSLIRSKRIITQLEMKPT